MFLEKDSTVIKIKKKEDLKIELNRKVWGMSIDHLCFQNVEKAQSLSVRYKQEPREPSLWDPSPTPSLDFTILYLHVIMCHANFW
jgi:hypothetical protein